MEVSDVIKMAERGRNEIGKSVKNPLLSGASLGFPFDNFQGTSLLLPVQIENPPVLLEDVGEVDTFVGQDKPAPDDLNLIPTNPSTVAAPASQGYTGLFSSIFGGSQPQKVEPALEVKPPEALSVESTPRSFSPYVHVPSVESYSPALFVPTEPEPLKDKKHEVPPLFLGAQPSVVPTAPWLGGNPPPVRSSFQQPPPDTSGISNPSSGQLASSFEAAPTPQLVPSTSEVQTPAGVPSSSSSSSSDSIVTDLQSRFASAAISKPPVNPSEPAEQASQQDGLKGIPRGRLGIFSSDQYPETQEDSNFFGSPQNSGNSYQNQSPAQHYYGAIGQPRSDSNESSANSYPFGVVGHPRAGAFPYPQQFVELSSSPLQTPPQPTPTPPVVGFPPPPTSSAPPIGFISQPTVQPFSAAPPPSGQFGGPTSIPPSSGGSTKSYRLGAQKRLAYAPVPGLAASPLSQFPPPPTKPTPPPNTYYNPQATSPAPTLYNPNATYLTSGETSTPQLFAPSPTLQPPPVAPQPSTSPDNVGPPKAQPAAFVPPPVGDVLPPAFVPTSSSEALPAVFPAPPSTEVRPPPPARALPPAFAPSPLTDVLPPSVASPSAAALPPTFAPPTSAGTLPPAFAPTEALPPAFAAPSSGGIRPPTFAPSPYPAPAPPISSPSAPFEASSTLFSSNPSSVPFSTIFGSQPPNSSSTNTLPSVSATSGASNTTSQYPLGEIPTYQPPQGASSALFPAPESNFYSFTPIQPTNFQDASNLFTPAPNNNFPQGANPNFFTPINPNLPPPPTNMAAKDDGTLNTVDLSPAPPRRSPSPSVVPQKLLNLGQSGIIYRPPYYHWFWNKDVEGKEDWQPFSMTDSFELEQAYNSASLTMDTVVATDGGRHDVQIVARRRDAVYWQEPSRDVRRCSWFYKPADTVVPYDENTAAILEEEYKAAVMTSSWKRQVFLENGANVILFGPTTMAHYPAEAPSPDAWDASTDLSQSTKSHPKEVKRGVEDFNIEDGEPAEIDHLLFFVHGIGSVCDLKMRSIEEAVRDFRNTAQELLKTHYKTTYDQGEVTRIEVLPVSWHQNLHSDTGVDEKLKKITLKSIPRLRHFTNDTLLDILFYTSPVFCQNIVQQVGQELNKLYDLFRERNPSFGGGVSVAGHSLGSLILFDMLCHQKKPNEEIKKESSPEGKAGEHKPVSRTASYLMGNAGTGQPCVTYPQLNFQPNSFFALGSPIGMFVTVRGIDSLGLDFQLPTCPGFYNIFHPYDPVAYRIEVLINPDLASKRPVLIPHHKGRKRMHLELRDTVARLGNEFKQKVVDSVRNTWNAVYQFATLNPGRELEQEVDRALESEIGRTRLESESTVTGEEEDQQGVCSGVVNQGRRVDYVLQEAPLESLNEYLSAIVSHVCYWDSEDTVLFILKDIYSNMGISADSPALMAAVAADDATRRPPSPPSPTSFAQPLRYHDPTVPMSSTASVPPPPMSGFVRK